MDSLVPPEPRRERRCGLRRSSAALLLICCALAAFSLPMPGAHADEAAVAELEAVATRAMESYDMLDYEAAKKLLSAAVTRAKEQGLEREPVLARVYISLGIVYFSGDNDPDSARAAFVEAVEVDPSIAISPAYRTAAMETLLDEVRASVAAAAVDDECAAIEGISHPFIDAAAAGGAVPVEAKIGSEVAAAADKVMLYFRPHGAPDASTEYTGVAMSPRGQCQYTGTIPGGMVRGVVVHYYILAVDEAGKRVASKGSSASPNIIEVTSADGDENPLGHGEIIPLAGGPTFFLSLAGGTGGAYVAGETEQLRSPVHCCFAPALVHIVPELGYYLSRRTSLSVAARIGFPIGANLANHATAAPAGLVRLRYALSLSGTGSGTGLHVSGAVGGGVIRQTVKLNVPLSDTMDTDTTAIGPLLVSGGIGYSKAMSKSLYVVAELTTTLGLPVVDSLGTAVLSFGVHVDASIGLRLML